MIKGMSFSSGVRTWRVFGWVSVICFASTFNSAVSQGVKLQTTPKDVEARCGENVTLTCEATLPSQSDIKLFAWLARNQIVCGHKDDPEVLCESTVENFHLRLTLTLINVKPIDHGEYLCKLRSNRGINSSTTNVTVKDCFGSFDSSINESHAKCWFSGVYSSGTVHWFQEGVNLTDSASTKEEVDQYGRYNILSTVDVQKGNLSQLYNCSLWIPSTGMYVSSKALELPVLEESTSSGSMVKLQWISIMVEIMMVKFIT